MTGAAQRDALSRVVRAEWGRMVAALARTARGDLGRAEDALQNAVLAAVHQWPRDGVPDHPVGWLLRTARHKLLDRIRRDAVHDRSVGVLLERSPTHTEPVALEDQALEDDHLRLIFACCHPALPAEAQLALTLKTVCGFTTPEVARAFLLDPRAAAQRIVRAKRRLRAAEWAIPGAEELPARLGGVLRVVYSLFTEGYAATSGADLVREALCDEALRLGGLLARLLPDQGEVHGLNALMLLHHARRHARTTPHGQLVLLPDQDRGRWDAAGIRRGMAALGLSLIHI